MVGLGWNSTDFRRQVVEKSKNTTHGIDDSPLIQSGCPLRRCQTMSPVTGFIQLRLQCEDLLRLRLQVMSKGFATPYECTTPVHKALAAHSLSFPPYAVEGLLRMSSSLNSLLWPPFGDLELPDKLTGAGQMLA